MAIEYIPAVGEAIASATPDSKLEYDIKQALAKLSEWRAIRNEIARMDEAEIACIQNKIAQDCADVNLKIAGIEAFVRTQTIALGKTVPGDDLQAVYVSGRVSWSDANLMGFAAAGHAEILPFRNAGEPSVQIRKRG